MIEHQVGAGTQRHRDAQRLALGVFEADLVVELESLDRPVFGDVTLEIALVGAACLLGQELHPASDRALGDPEHAGGAALGVAVGEQRANRRVHPPVLLPTGERAGGGGEPQPAATASISLDGARVARASCSSRRVRRQAPFRGSRGSIGSRPCDPYVCSVLRQLNAYRHHQHPGSVRGVSSHPYHQPFSALQVWPLLRVSGAGFAPSEFVRNGTRSRSGAVNVIDEQPGR